MRPIAQCSKPEKTVWNQNNQKDSPTPVHEVLHEDRLIEQIQQIDIVEYIHPLEHTRQEEYPLAHKVIQGEALKRKLVQKHFSTVASLVAQNDRK